MANPFSQAKDMYELAKKAKAIQKELKSIEVEAVNKDETISVTMNGEFRITAIDIDESFLNPDQKFALEKGLMHVTGEALSKAQQVAAEQMKSISGDLGLPTGLMK
jgi:DNA-binding YbaB/EbfC family protein